MLEGNKPPRTLHSQGKCGDPVSLTLLVVMNDHILRCDPWSQVFALMRGKPCGNMDLLKMQVQLATVAMDREDPCRSTDSFLRVALCPRTMEWMCSRPSGAGGGGAS